MPRVLERPVKTNRPPVNFVWLQAGPAPTSANALGQGMKSPPEALNGGCRCHTSHNPWVPHYLSSYTTGHPPPFPFCDNRFPNQDNIMAAGRLGQREYHPGNQPSDIGVQNGQLNK